jgi:hypothetical protein
VVRFLLYYIPVLKVDMIKEKFPELTLFSGGNAFQNFTGDKETLGKCEQVCTFSLHV